MQARGVTVITRRISYVPRWIPDRNQALSDPRASLGQTVQGQLVAHEEGFEKGIDLAIGLDLVRYAREGRFDVGVLVSQDRDLHEAVEEVHRIGAEKREVLPVEIARLTDRATGPFHTSPPFDAVQWITRAVFQACIDLTDYRIAPP